MATLHKPLFSLAILAALLLSACQMAQPLPVVGPTQTETDAAPTTTAPPPTSTPIRSLTGKPTRVPTNTMAPSPTLTPPPSPWTTLVTLDDLPQGFRHLTTPEMNSLRPDLPPMALSFGFMDESTSQAALVYMLPLNWQEMPFFDDNLAFLIAEMAAGYGYGGPFELRAELDPIGDSRYGTDFTAGQGSQARRWEMLVFRTGPISTYVFSSYPPEVEVAVEPRDLAELIDARIIQIMGLAGCREALAATLTDLPGKLAFVSYRDGSPNIYTLDAAGSGLIRLTDNPAGDFYPAWSPDGTRLAFYSERDGNAEIYVINADGTGLTRLTNHNANDYYPDWSPDGSQIAFHSHRYLGAGRIFVMNADGSQVKRLTDPSFDDWGPDWSPDGLQIVFNSSRGPSRDIWIMSADGSGMYNLTNYPGDDWAPRWSPDGRRILFHSNRMENNMDIYTIQVDGSITTRLTNHPAADTNAAWSPDGEYIAFTSNRCGDNDIWMMRSDGTDLVNLTRHPANDWFAAWGSQDNP